MTRLQRKTALGQSLAAAPSAVGSHTRINTNSDSDSGVQSRARFYCTPAAPALQPAARTAADPARFGLHWLVWLSLTYARNGLGWPEAMCRARGRGEKGRRGVRG